MQTGKEVLALISDRPTNRDWSRLVSLIGSKNSIIGVDSTRRADHPYRLTNRRNGAINRLNRRSANQHRSGQGSPIGTWSQY
jgi:hypothetical protein